MNTKKIPLWAAKQIDSDKLESIIDAWAKSVEADNNGWASMFNTKSHQSRQEKILELKEELQEQIRADFGECNWRLIQQEIDGNKIWVLYLK
jgi:hypothetical protein